MIAPQQQISTNNMVFRVYLLVFMRNDFKYGFIISSSHKYTISFNSSKWETLEYLFGLKW